MALMEKMGTNCEEGRRVTSPLLVIPKSPPALFSI